MRPNDRLSRHGGEEFLLLMPSTDAAGAQRACQRLCHLIASTPVSTTAGPLPITVSIGLTSARPSDERIDTVLIRADQALYACKRSGRNRVMAL